jgi:septum formation protein
MTLWLASDPLVLASGSAVRRQVLEAAGIPVEARPADIDERAIEASAGTDDPGEVASLLAQEKARAV